MPRDKKGRIDYAKDFFGKQTSLTVSGQLEGELGATALGDIYTFGPTFRAENSNTPRHLAEFWMIEPEMAFYDIQDNMDLAEDFIKHLVSYALEHCMDDIQFLNDRYDPELVERLRSVIGTEFVRLEYTEGIRILEEAVKNGVQFEYPVSWGVDLQKSAATPAVLSPASSIRVCCATTRASTWSRRRSFPTVPSSRASLRAAFPGSPCSSPSPRPSDSSVRLSV